MFHHSLFRRECLRKYILTKMRANSDVVCVLFKDLIALFSFCCFFSWTTWKKSILNIHWAWITQSYAMIFLTSPLLCFLVYTYLINVTVVYAFKLWRWESSKSWYDLDGVSRFWQVVSIFCKVTNRDTILGKRDTIFGLLDTFWG